MLDAISNSKPRTDADQDAKSVTKAATGYVELDSDSFVTAPFVGVDLPIKTTLFVDGISPSDVQQGAVGDCTLQASMASLARTLGGRKFLQDNVKANCDDAGNVTSYTATLFKKNASGAYERTMVTVPSNCFASYGAVHAMDGTGVEVWPRVYEAAMLQLNHGVPCTNMPDAMAMLTGRPAVDISTADAHLEEKLLRGFQLGQVQVLSTTGKVTKDIDDPKLKEGHAYTLVAVTVKAVPQADGSFNVERFYQLRNPWGYDHPRELTGDELKKYFSTYSEGDVP